MMKKLILAAALSAILAAVPAAYAEYVSGGGSSLLSLIATGSAPTITNGTCTFGGTITQVGGNVNGTYSASTGTCTSGQTFTITLATTAPNGWNCWENNQTHNTAQAFKTTTTTTVVTMAENATATTAGDVLNFSCFPY